MFLLAYTIVQSVFQRFKLSFCSWQRISFAS